ncbi:MAG: hypothetical protein O3B33_08915 [Proteobacteria bacterium]|nr:hypothetical protein [Pseudomonadota bacterium]MDA1043401.1 hypothetical protein [Pseudomonadota bacterium]
MPKGPSFVPDRSSPQIKLSGAKPCAVANGNSRVMIERTYPVVDPILTSRPLGHAMVCAAPGTYWA